ncbi:winged helix-turn-helix domain-containing protein [Haloechinothrix sp. LS1_15]|uniref:ArsR/SmtB family transcription factor n=1 Tax=Haloechinothrix sp. LS1_15 TaxID=2652248 RepID=UPI0029481586|nr:winged helix-turn-helix domain-containing protein [Haloechinothrix sp. LS1_15]MDV6014269.1 winged helix-turn-helix transcriptional regulator [Haloechinothrix sp. LS1_15]
MADQTEPSDRFQVPDYELDDELELTSHQQYRALFHDTRAEIVNLLLERAATTSDLAEALDKPKGTVGHHLKILAEAGLVRVVRTERVRAIDAKYYGRTARVFLFNRVGEAVNQPQRTISLAAHEIADVSADSELPQTVGLRHVRIPAERAEQWKQRLHALVDEFVREPRGGDVTFGLLIGLYPTRRQSLPDTENREQE